MTSPRKAYRGLPMEGPIASWYTRNTGRNPERFRDHARAAAERLGRSGDVLEVAFGPGYLALELARMGHRVSGIDISHSFVRIARQKAAEAGLAIDFRHGDAAHMPFADGSFDYAVCSAAFKNFTDPVGALDEMYRVLRPGGRAVIYDLRKEAALPEIEAEVRGMGLSRLDAAVTRWIFRRVLLRSAYPREELLRLARASRFGASELVASGITNEWILRREPGA